MYILYILKYLKKCRAQGLFLLNEYVNVTMCTSCLPWKYVDHGIDPVLLVPVREGQHLDAKGEERSVEETVQQKHLA